MCIEHQYIFSYLSNRRKTIVVTFKCKLLLGSQQSKHQSNVWNQFKVSKKTPERSHWHLSGVFIVKFKKISNIALAFPLLTLNEYFPTGYPIFLLKKHWITGIQSKRGKHTVKSTSEIIYVCTYYIYIYIYICHIQTKSINFN